MTWNTGRSPFARRRRISTTWVARTLPGASGRAQSGRSMDTLAPVRRLAVEPVGRVDPARFLVQLRAATARRRLADLGPLPVAGGLGGALPMLLGKELVD